MKTDFRKNFARTVKELYLYPLRSRGENMFRGGVWILSWFIGVELQQPVDSRALGGACAIFSISLLLEFASEKKNKFWAVIGHGAFCFALWLMAMGSFLLVCGDIPTTNADMLAVYSFMSDHMLMLGRLVAGYMLIGSILAMFEAHKLIYDEERIWQEATAAEQLAVREIFEKSLKGVLKGGNEP